MVTYSRDRSGESSLVFYLGFFIPGKGMERNESRICWSNRVPNRRPVALAALSKLRLHKIRFENRTFIASYYFENYLVNFIQDWERLHIKVKQTFCMEFRRNSSSFENIQDKMVEKVIQYTVLILLL